jgi:hypothetical protein
VLVRLLAHQPHPWWWRHAVTIAKRAGRRATGAGAWTRRQLALLLAAGDLVQGNPVVQRLPGPDEGTGYVFTFPFVCYLHFSTLFCHILFFITDDM